MMLWSLHTRDTTLISCGIIFDVYTTYLIMFLQSANILWTLDF